MKRKTLDLEIIPLFKGQPGRVLHGKTGSCKMKIQKEKINDILIFSLNGRFDSNTFREFEKEIFNEIEKRSYFIILNLEQLDYISSAGLRAILRVTKSLKNFAGKLVICSIPDSIAEIFEISGFNFFLKIAPNLEEATKEFD